MKKYSFRDKEYIIKYSNDPEEWRCDPPKYEKPRMIVPDGKTKKDLGGLLHEMLHALWWDADESVIEQLELDLRDALWKEGWRKNG